MVAGKTINMLRRGRSILQEEGLRAFIKKAALYLKNIFSFYYRTYYIYENTLNGAQFKPKVQDVSLKIISAPEDFDELSEKGFNLSPWNINALKTKATRKAIAFCVLVGGNLAHVTWVALSEEAKNDVDPFPVKINWQSEALSGSSRTNERYQRMGLYYYVYSEIFRFLRETGRIRDRFTIEKNNTASNHTLAKFGSVVIAEGWCLKVLFWKFWKEKAL